VTSGYNPLRSGQSERLMKSLLCVTIAARRLHYGRPDMCIRYMERCSFIEPFPERNKLLKYQNLSDFKMFGLISRKQQRTENHEPSTF